MNVLERSQACECSTSECDGLTCDSVVSTTSHDLSVTDSHTVEQAAGGCAQAQAALKVHHSNTSSGPGHHITSTTADYTAILCINRVLVLFELLLRAMAPCVEQTDQLLMLLSGVQVHWLPMLHDRFLHHATLLAIAATDIGRDIIHVGLLNDKASTMSHYCDPGLRMTSLSRRL